MPGLTGTIDVIAFTGDASWCGYTMVSGRWIDKPGEAVVPTPFLAATDTHIGDTVTRGDMVVTLNALSVILTLMLVAVAALGVLNGALLDTRERIRELGVHKALGMTPRQTITMVITPVVMTGLVAGNPGVPLGVALHGWVIPAMGDSVRLRLPGSVLAVYHGAELLRLALGGLLIAALGALLPAGWAARARTATALRTE
ncbi:MULTISPECIES: FtsX-like permease family protein [unclassified Streptomyces]|uniref:FtsX-like permease family protein n=1 Tax=unclassified Streptomyces TaxID=2593676 RepID=UPI0035E1B90F